MFQRILVPLDGSRRAERILPHVEKLARCFDSEVIFMQVIEPIPVTVMHHEFYSARESRDIPELSSRAEDYLSGLQGEFRSKEIAAKRVVEFGPVVEIIQQVAEREQVDLIALASHGRTGLSRVFYGSVAAGLLQRVDRPLLLIRSNGSD